MRAAAPAIVIAAVVIYFGLLQRAPTGMILIPAGDFLMGTDETDEEGLAEELGIAKPWFLDEKPAHTVSLPAYYIDQYEVTNAHYKKFTDETGYPVPPYWEDENYPEGTGDYPVVAVSWEDAHRYCQWAGKRLPTEAEWEKAARGTDGRKYPWGNRFDQKKANVGGSRGGLTPVGSSPQGKSPYGIHDMIGSVWEWTDSWYLPYAGNTYQNENFGKRLRVLRGNSYVAIGHFPPDLHTEVVAHHSTTTFRLFFDPQGAIGDIGFRCAKSP